MDYKSLSVKELRDTAVRRGLSADVAKGMKKAELVTHLAGAVISHVAPPAPQKKALSLFSGAGGDSCGLEAAGWEVTHFSEFSAPATKTHLAAFPSSKLLTGSDGSSDIKKVPDSEFAALKGTTDLIFAGHPCFVAGTKVLTDKGYIAIESVEMTHKLKTHTDKFQPIVNLQRKMIDGNLVNMRIKYHPVSIKGTVEHPFFVRTRMRKWDNENRKYVFEYRPAQWKKLGDLTKDDFCGMVIDNNSVIPSHSISVKRNASRIDTVTINLDKKDMWFTMGYFVGDGWIQDTKKADGRSKHSIYFAINNKDEEYVVNRIKTVLPITDKRSKSGACSKFGCCDAVWFEILKEFGKYAHGKIIPDWVHTAPAELIQEFLNGYIRADGCYRKRGDIRITTVSYDLAMSVQRLYLKLGKIASVQHTERKETHTICGRTVNQRSTYEISLIPEKTKQHSGFIEGGYAWMAPFKLEHIKSDPCLVYNFEVEVDNSYVVENTVVHNCQGFSHAGKKRTDDPRNELVHEFIRAARHAQPTWIIGENVKGLLSRRGVYPANTSPRPVIDIIKELFEAVGYKLTYRIIDATEVGVPQVRKRLLYVGHKGTLYPHLPWDKLGTPAEKPTIRALLTATLEGAMELPALYKPAEQPARFWIATTLTAATGAPHPNLERLVGGFRNLSTKEKTDLGHTKGEKVPHVEPNGLISFGVRKSGYHGQVLDPDAPSKTIICTYNLCPRLFVGLHNAATGKYWIRCLTPAECAAIQGFPADYAWTGSAKERIIQIGNAVPPPLATAVANLLKIATFEERPQAYTPGVAVADSDSEEED